MDKIFVTLEAARQVICDACARPGCPRLCGNNCDRIDRLIAISAADVRPVVHGNWAPGRETGREYIGDCLVSVFYDRWTCSECGYIVDGHTYSKINYNFCPHCGADMREPQILEIAGRM